MFELTDKTVLHLPSLSRFVRDGIYFSIDGDAPNWIATDGRGAGILDLIDGKRPFGEVVREYAALQPKQTMDGAKAWLHVHSFIREALRHGIIASVPFQRPRYTGRADYLKPTRLREFWFHTNNSCNLTCAHCLVESHPGGDPGLTTERLKSVMDEVSELGAHRFYFTGGEPFVRQDIFELIEYITLDKKAELIILTNATLFRGERLELLKRQDRGRLKLQVSLDGSTPGINDPIRGKGTFSLITEGLKTASDLGFETSLTAAVTGTNIGDMVNLPALARSLGAKSLHLMWLHRRGRALDLFKERFPTHDQLLYLAREVKKRSDTLGITFDNYESLKLRVNGRHGVKFDLGNACWDSLCLYSDGHLYPSASFAGYSPLDMGDATARSVKALWLESPVARRFRAASVINKSGVDGDAYRFITGGGDIEHSYFSSESRNGTGAGTILGEDPYYPLYREMIQDVMHDLARKKRGGFNTRSGFSAPVIYHAMGEGGIVCGTEEERIGDPAVSTLHSNCVLSFDVEKPHKIVQEFYGKAAEKPQAELCCPVNYEADEIGHIPAEVLQRFYGCGSPMTLGGVRLGEVVVDLGSGSGIDCFIAAKKTGPEGRVIGVDMTDEMLAVANRNKRFVADNLGYDVVEFRKGYLERIPVEDRSVDLITSNCVINLSPDKPAVFAEMWRVLKDRGRIVISDIVTEEPVPPALQADERLWGECLSGALTEDAFLSGLERAGFYGLEILKKIYWKEVEGYRFYSVTARGYKYEKKEGCIYIGQRAIYRGPFTAVMDEEGHLFPRNESVEVCTDTASKLSADPYAAHFTVIEPDQEIIKTEQTVAGGEKNACGPGCC
ncbi:MAG: methyltransferase domain-containing protein [Nitrospirae bacterium]|nr:methyltransferase domain-containing protein [Nitrospirota bacterium]